ncbi:MAG: histidine kinase dimerization/phospho-acceptor domain-containing protein, partial [Desulfobacterales bacterium]
MVNLTTVEPSYDESLKAPIKNHRIEWDDIDRKLIERPSFSFRLQVILGFLLLFFLSMTTLIGSMAGIRQIQNKLSFVLATERFLFEIEQARRWEKNYFLYGTNLTDAAESANNAKILLSQNLKSYQKIAQQQAEEIVKNLDGYQNLLNDLSLFDRKSPSGGPAKKHEIEIELRKKGSAMVEIAASLARKEEDSMNDLLNLIQRIPIYALAVYLFLLTYIIYFLSQRFMKRLNSLVNSTQRIASGGFSPIIPIHKTRDEFTTVSVAINKMMEELDSRQTAMVESHKLKAIGTLTAGVAHELNNPINNIMLTAYSLLEEYEELSKRDMLEMINDLIKEADRSRSIVRNLLDFARESESVSELINLGELVEETLKL